MTPIIRGNTLVWLSSLASLSGSLRKHFGLPVLVPSIPSILFTSSTLAPRHLKKHSPGEGSFGVDTMSLRRSGLQKEVLSLYRRFVLFSFPSSPHLDI